MRKKRVAVYVRQTKDKSSSYLSAKQHYVNSVKNRKEWLFSGIYVDKRKCYSQLDLLLEECKKGKIDMILTQSVTRFGRNIVDTVETARELSNLNPPVAVQFDIQNINTLDEKTKPELANICMDAEMKRQQRSEVQKWVRNKKAELLRMQEEGVCANA